MTKHIGLIGGLSPESTVHYYEHLCREFNRIQGGLQFPEITLRSLNLQGLIDLFDADDWDGVAAVLLDSLDRLKAAGADFAAILANTPHNAYERIRETSPLKIVTIMDATTEALADDRKRRVALLGTRPTMEHGFFQNHFQSQGVEALTPTTSQRRELDRIIWDELSHGEVNPESLDAVIEMIDDLVNAGAEAIVLGCTELCMLVAEGDSPCAIYDTTKLHATAILRYALNDRVG